MKKIIYIACAAAALAAVSCAKTAEFDSVKPARSTEGVTIRFTTGDMSTRATVPGVDNENKIKRIDFFIFPSNLGEDGKMVGTTEYVYKGSIVPEDGGLKGEYETTFAPGKLGELCGQVRCCGRVSQYDDSRGCEDLGRPPCPGGR